MIYTLWLEWLIRELKKSETCSQGRCCPIGCGSVRGWCRLLRDHHHPAATRGNLEQIAGAGTRFGCVARRRRACNAPETSYPPELPITARRDEIVAAIRAHQVVVIAGETGSGKTTQIPKMCLEAGPGHRGQNRLHAAAPRRRAVHLPAHRRGVERGLGPRGRLQDPVR